MSAKAAIRKGDLNRYLDAAKARGFTVEITGDTVRFLPTAPDASVTSDSAVTPAQEALARWRRSA